jgi:hypothetical protein
VTLPQYGLVKVLFVYQARLYNMPRSKSTLPGGTRTSDLAVIGALGEHLPVELVEGILKETGKQGSRERQLPADFMTLFVVALALYRDVSSEEVLRCVVQGLQWAGRGPNKISTKGGIAQARQRLGVEPLRLLFERSCAQMAVAGTRGAWYRGWLTVAMDGTTFALADSPENARVFGYSGVKSKGSYPILQCVCLAETGTHAAFATALGPYGSGEKVLALQVLPKLKPGMLMLADRGFGFEIWKEALATGADLALRISSIWTLTEVEALPDGSHLARVRLPSTKEEVVVRLVRYTIDGSEEVYRLVTNILDPSKAPAAELAALYHERWEVESIFDELKTHLRGARMILRSRTPELVEQEFWGFMLAHRALRSLIHQAALKHQLDPDEISFTHTIRVVKRTLPRRAALSP